jgi:hypothetical protein
MRNYLYRNNTYSIAKCTLDDIPSHLEKVLSYYSPDTVCTQKERMEQAVQNGTAYKMTCNGSTAIFFYYEIIDKQNVMSIAFWSTNINILLLGLVHFRSKTTYQFIHIVPHNNELRFTYLIETDSIKAYHYHNKPLVIDMYSDKCRTAIKNIYEKMVIKVV